MNVKKKHSLCLVSFKTLYNTRIGSASWKINCYHEPFNLKKIEKNGAVITGISLEKKKFRVKVSLIWQSSVFFSTLFNPWDSIKVAIFYIIRSNSYGKEKFTSRTYLRVIA